MKTNFSHLLLLFFLLIAQTNFSQNNKLLLGQWFKANSDSSSDNDFLKLYFLPNGIFYVSMNQSKGQELHYKINGTSLILNNVPQKIIKLTPDSLVIKNTALKKAPIITFKRTFTIKKSFYDSAQYFIKNKDTIFLENYDIRNSFKGNKAYFLNRVPLPTYKETFSMATFFIDTLNRVRDIRIIHHINKRFDLNLINIIKNSEKYWVCAKLKNKKVNALKILYFVGYEMQNINAGRINKKINRSNRSNYSTKYRTYFILALKQYLLKNYKNAINLYERCKKLTNKTDNCNIQIALCYKALGEKNKYNQIINSLKKSKLKYIFNQQLNGLY
ncbi:MAG: hypothetical protein ACWA42_05495 [Lutibacter sp.]